MVTSDTVKLLKECDSGIKMGVASIDQVLGRVSSKDLKIILSGAKSEHEILKKHIKELLVAAGEGGKEPSAFTRGMSKMKAGMMLFINESDSTIADIMTDGCNMGIKSLSRYLNKYGAAEERSRDAARRLISIEEKMATDMRPYL